jgi:hypothetical protein
MKFTIPYLYKFWYVPTKCINDREAFSRAAVEVEIAELGDTDAPVVMKVANPPTKQMASLGYARFIEKPDGEPRRVRTKDGYFYIEGYSADELVQRASNLATLNTTFLSWVGKHEQSPGESEQQRRTITSVSEIRWRRDVGGLRDDKTRDDGGAKIGAKIVAQAAKMILIDGVSYELCREPILAILMEKKADPVCGIVEAYKSLDDRLAGYNYSENSSYTSSLVHAENTMRQAGLDPSGIRYEVIEPNWSSYDGVASDIMYHLTRASNKLKDMVKAAPSGALQAFYAVREALGNIDHSCPSISAEVIASAQGIVDIAADPDIDEPMEQLSNARYMNDTSGRKLHGGNPNDGSPFFLGLDHVSDYRDRLGNAASAKFYAERVIDRWEGRHPQSTFDNGQTHRMTSKVAGGLTVTEIGSDARARLAARELYVAYSVIDQAIEMGSRIFRVSTHARFAETDLSLGARSGIVGLVIAPAVGVPDGQWNVFTNDHPAADRVLEAVGEHVEAMDERDMEISQDQQLISIF